MWAGGDHSGGDCGIVEPAYSMSVCVCLLTCPYISVHMSANKPALVCVHTPVYGCLCVHMGSMSC